MTAPHLSVPRIAWRNAASHPGARDIPEETPVAITYNRVTHAVMMATPADLHDFAVGFSLSENIVPEAAALEEFTIVEVKQGIELRLWIAVHHMAALEKRRRRLAGATGCGMCGLESLEEALRPVPQAPPGLIVTPAAIESAVASLAPAQSLNHITRAVHAAGFWRSDAGLIALREDVGRHNALDKLHGAMTLAGEAAANGILVMTSRISIELVQKAGRMNAAILAAVSAPTALAVRAAQASGLTLIGIARPDGFEVFTHPHRVAS